MKITSYRVPVWAHENKFKPYGKTAPCQLILDPVTNHLYGNPFLVIMPLHDNAFDLCAEVLNED